MTRAKKLIPLLCLTLLLVAFAAAAQAADIKIGKYANDQMLNGEFTWHIILKADKTFELMTGDFEGIHNMTGKWTADSSGKITANIDNGEPLVFTGGGTDTITLTKWPYGHPADNTPFTFDPSYK